MMILLPRRAWVRVLHARRCAGGRASPHGGHGVEPSWRRPAPKCARPRPGVCAAEARAGQRSRLQVAPVRLVIARCSVDYAGRLTAHLPSAPRLLIVKADGSVLGDSAAGRVKPTTGVRHATER